MPSIPESLGNLGTTMTFSLLFHLLLRGHFFLVATSHSWQGDNPVLPGSPPGSKCSQGPHVGGIRHFLFFVVFFFFPQQGCCLVISLSPDSVFSLPCRSQLQMFTGCFIVGTVQLFYCWGSRRVTPPNDHSLKNHRRKLFSFLCVITIKEVFTFLPERQAENAHVRGVLIYP